jgi:hypothetical protein
MTIYRGQAKVPPYMWNPYQAYGPVMSQNVNVMRVTVRRYRQRQTNHVFHLVMTMLTCGFWLPVWIGCVVFNILVDRWVYR